MFLKSNIKKQLVSQSEVNHDHKDLDHINQMSYSLAPIFFVFLLNRNCCRQNKMYKLQLRYL